MLLFVAIVTAGQLYTFHHYNAILNGTAARSNVPPVKTNPTQSAQTAQEIVSLKQQYPTATVSAGGHYIAYIDAQNTLHIRDLSTDKDVATATNLYPVVFVSWAANEQVFVGEKNNGDLLLKTVDSTSGTGRVIHTFSGFSASATFKKITYSALTNDVYILIGSDYASVVYHFDTNGTLTQVDLGGRLIKNIAVTETQNILYFEDYAAGTFNVLSLDNGQIQVVQRNAALIGAAGTTLFYGQINQAGLVTSVYKEASDGTAVLVSNMKAPVLAGNITITADQHVQVTDLTAKTSS